VHSEQGTVPAVDDVIVPPAETRAPRSAAVETEAFLSLSEALARAPDTAIQRLVEVAMKLTGSDAAGVSLDDVEGGEAVFRWVAVAGEFSRYLNGTMPRHFSPCGTTVERAKTLVMRDPVRFFPYISKLHVQIRTALLVPFPQRGRLVGTLWVLSHRAEHVFTVDDVRVVESLTTFSSSLLDALGARRSKRVVPVSPGPRVFSTPVSPSLSRRGRPGDSRRACPARVAQRAGSRLGHRVRFVDELRLEAGPRRAPRR
jgi:hypothetical protein